MAFDPTGGAAGGLPPSRARQDDRRGAAATRRFFVDRGRPEAQKLIDADDTLAAYEVEVTGPHVLDHVLRRTRTETYRRSGAEESGGDRQRAQCHDHPRRRPPLFFDVVYRRHRSRLLEQIHAVGESEPRSRHAIDAPRRHDPAREERALRSVEPVADVVRETGRYASA